MLFKLLFAPIFSTDATHNTPMNTPNLGRPVSNPAKRKNLCQLSGHSARHAPIVLKGPPWAKDEEFGNQLINARLEKVAEKRPSLGLEIMPLHRTGCGVLRMEGDAGPGRSKPFKQPFYITRKDGQPMSFAGLSGAIPALAGKTAFHRSREGERRVHPRAGGENYSRAASRVHGGSIPALAGKTSPQDPSLRLKGVHPRAGGENWRRLSSCRCWGPSPRWRGKPRA